MTIFREFTKLSQGSYIDLYTLDLTSIGTATRYYFVSDTATDGTLVSYKGQNYTALPILVEGFESTSKAPFPKPTLTISNITGIVSSIMGIYDQLVGAKVVRVRTLVKYLAGGSEAGGESLAPEIYYIETPLEETETYCSFELINGLEMGGLTLPKRVITRRCAWVYRGVECGYTGNQYYTQDDQPTNEISQDKCSHTLYGCKVHFGFNAELPYGGFPSVDIF